MMSWSLNYEFVCVFLFFCLIFLLCAIFIKNRLLKKIFVVLLAIFFALATVEFILSLSMDKYDAPCKFKIRNIEKNITVTLKGIHFYDNSKKNINLNLN